MVAVVQGAEGGWIDRHGPHPMQPSFRRAPKRRRGRMATVASTAPRAPGAPELAELAALVADRTRAAFCIALLDGRAWTAGELATHAGVAASTASEHLGRLVAGGLLVGRRQGRHRDVELAGPRVADLLETLVAHSEPGAGRPRTLRAANASAALARGRTCYDHLAGRLGVTITDAMSRNGLLDRTGGFALTARGTAWLTSELRVDPAVLRSTRRPTTRACLDWTERRPHLAGAAGAALALLPRRGLGHPGTGRPGRAGQPGRRCGAARPARRRPGRPDPAPEPGLAIPGLAIVGAVDRDDVGECDVDLDRAEHPAHCLADLACELPKRRAEPGDDGHLDRLRAGADPHAEDAALAGQVGGDRVDDGPPSRRATAGWASTAAATSGAPGTTRAVGKPGRGSGTGGGYPRAPAGRRSGPKGPVGTTRMTGARGWLR